MSVQGEACCYKFYDEDSDSEILFKTGCRWIRRAKVGDIVAYNIRINHHGEVHYRPTRAFVYGITNNFYKLKVFKCPCCNDVKYFSVSIRRIYIANQPRDSFMLFSDTYDSSYHLPPSWYNNHTNGYTIAPAEEQQPTPSEPKVISSQEALSIVDEIKENLTDGQYLKLCDYFMEMKKKE